jgi:hypothetical protein
LKDLLAAVREEGWDKIINTKYIGKIFRSWGWSWKIPARIQVHKYTPVSSSISPLILTHKFSFTRKTKIDTDTSLIGFKTNPGES